jgi:hypothetical protein
MSVEIVTEMVLYRPPPEEVKVEIPPELEAEESEPEIPPAPIHDLESVWWVGVWTLINHVPLEFMDSRPQLKKALDKLFPFDATPARHKLFADDGPFIKETKDVVCRKLSHVVHQLEGMRKKLHVGYHAKSFGKEEVVSSLHSMVLEHLLCCIKEEDVALLALTDEHLPDKNDHVGKRQKF